MEKKIMVALLLASLNVHSGVMATTANSRANCYNNESVTWWLNHSYNWKVVSTHYNITSGDQHLIDTGYTYTWRQAAIHWNEAPPDQHKWIVTGYHFLMDYGNGRIPFETTLARNCDLYDGWWDH